MKSQLSLNELAQKLTDQKSLKKDYVVESNNLRFYSNGSNQLHLNGKNKMGEEIDQVYDVNDVALNQITTKVGISKKYADKMLDGHKSLFNDNVNYWFENTPKPQMIRTLDNQVRAVLSDKYKRVDNDMIAEQVLPILLDKEYDIKSCAITDTKMYIKASLPSLQREVNKGDVVESGVIISNSEVGHGAVNVSPFIHRLVCMNGMVVNTSKLNSRHLTSSQSTIDGVWSILSDEAKELDSQALLAKVRDVVASTSDEMRFEEQVQMMSNASQIKIKRPKKVIELLENKFDLTKNEGESILENLINRDDKQPMSNLWSVVNSITALGNTMDDYDRGTKMQEIGGRLLTMPELVAA